jgi:ribosome maturation factor RimP
LIKKDSIIKLADEFLKDTSNYLIEVHVSTSNKIRVFIENDEHVSIQDCIALSKHIEHSLDRESEDFELEVSSPGIDQPLKHDRQFKKYQGKDVAVTLNDGKQIQGKLIELKDNQIILSPKANKKLKKQPTLTSFSDDSNVSIPLADAKETRLVIVF